MVKGFIFDLDGTVYLGDEPIEGAAQAINTLKNRGDRVVFLSNKPISTRKSYVDKLNKMGIKTKLDEVLNSNFILANYLKSELKDGEAVYVIGEAPLIEELELKLIKITENPLEAKFVVLSWDRNFTYDKINDAYQSWSNGAKIIATNPDRTCPMEKGQIPDCGAMIGAIEGTTGVTIDYIVGKPSKIAAKAAINALGLDSLQCYMVGDRLETDIKMGNENGMNSVLVLTGITSEDMVSTTVYKPKYTLNSIRDIVNL
jgi:arabinose operon protein AraL